MSDVIKHLEALASGFGTQDEDMLLHYYSMAYSDLGTDQEKEVFKLGAIAMFADLGKMRIRRAYYTWKFRRELKKLKGVEK